MKQPIAMNLEGHGTEDGGGEAEDGGDGTNK